MLVCHSEMFVVGVRCVISSFEVLNEKQILTLREKWRRPHSLGKRSRLTPQGGGNSLIWAIRGRAAGQGMVFWPRCPKQGIQFDLALPYTGSEPVLNRVWYYEP